MRKVFGVLALVGAMMLFGSTVAYAAAGDLDTTFASSGVLDQATGASNSATDGFILSDGSFIMCGNFTIAKFDSNGALVTTFGGNGTGYRDDLAHQVTSCAYQGSNKFVVMAYDTHNFFVGRFGTTTGTIDTGFGVSGWRTVDIEANDYVPSYGSNSVTVDSNGKIIGVGSSWPNTGSVQYLSVFRLTASGGLDTSFDSDGKVETVYSSYVNEQDSANAVTVNSSGKIIVTGTAYTNTGAFPHEIPLIVEYNDNGSLNTSFDSDGMEITDFNTGTDVFPGLFQAVTMLGTAGKIAAVGEIEHANGSFEMAAAVYSSTGALDTGFDSDGKWSRGTTGGVNEGLATVTMTVGGNAKLLIAGNDNGGEDFSVIRLNGNGTLDTGFSGDGIVSTDINANEDDRALAVDLQPSGKILAMGLTVSSQFFTSDIGAARYLVS